MRLKRLEVFGFKSFFDKTVITFREGITGIVGPNGCGKSNFADAILWVLGEQSPKNLRGERMEDVIFNGTEQRKPLSVAEVSLTIGDISNELPPPYTPYAELTLSRRLYRSGESEYLINKTPCRLKDIRDLLIDIGAGYRAHTIIEQGKVDDLITASPMQRREIVEEAAGIAKYRLRKAEALRKLEATEHNLTRVSDIIGEIKRQRNALDRQAKKAEKCQEMSASLKTVELQIARHEWLKWKDAQETVEQEETALQEISDTCSTQLATQETEQATSRLELTQKEEILSQLGRQISEVEKNVQRWEGKVEMIHAQRQEWHEAQSRTDQEISELKRTRSALDNEQSILGTEISEIAQMLPRAESSLTDHEKKANSLKKIVLLKDDDLEHCKVTVFDLAAQLTTSKNNLNHFQIRKESLLKQKERLRVEQETIDEKLESAAYTLKQVTEKGKRIDEQLATQRQEEAETSDLLKKTEAAIQIKEKQLLQVKENWIALKAKIASHEGFYRGFLKKREGAENLLLQLEGLQGMAADLIDVPARYESSIEAVLGNRLRSIVVKDHAEIKKGIDALRNTETGRHTFLPRHPRTLKQDQKIPDKGIIGRAIDLVSVRPGYESIAACLLDGIVVVSNFQTALTLWQTHPAVAIWVTLDGEVIDQSGLVTGGEQGKKGLLRQKRELKELTVQANKFQEETLSLQHEIEKIKKVSEKTRLKLATLFEANRLLDVEQIKGENEQKTLADEVERLQDEHQTILFEQEEGAREEATRNEAESAEQQLISRTVQLKEEKERALEDLKIVLIEHRQTLNQLNEEVVQLRMETNSLKEKERHTIEKQTRVKREKEHLTARLKEMILFEKSLHEKMDSSTTEEAEAVSTIETFSEKLAAHLEAIREAREAHAVLLSRLQKEEKEILSLRSKLTQTQTSLQEKALKKVSVEMSRQNIEEAIFSRYQIELSAMVDLEKDLPIEEAQEKAKTLQQKLDVMGPVNLAAIEEYKELDTRFQFLSTQEADLVQSMESLREAISKINKTTRGLFVETFLTLNQKFGEVYTSFFGGGSAELVLLDEAHPLESGIELFAQPPGKGKRNILLLSGGEKALTAISLLFATFLIHPTPFCLLDEIDAPLDEENTRRFSQTLVKMSDQTQFIVVTHNRFTMEIADVLYGVTMEETGISKLVSVNLNIPKGSRQSEEPRIHSISTIA